MAKKTDPPLLNAFAIWGITCSSLPKFNSILKFNVGTYDVSLTMILKHNSVIRNKVNRIEISKMYLSVFSESYHK